MIDRQVLDYVGVVYQLAEEKLGLARSWRVMVSPGTFGPEVRLRVYVASHAPGGRTLEATFTHPGIRNDDQWFMARRVVDQLAAEVERLVRERSEARR